MTLALNKSKLDNLTSDIWKSAERLWGKFKAYEYQNVILPTIVIRRLKCVLIGRGAIWEGRLKSAMTKTLSIAFAPSATHQHDTFIIGCTTSRL